MLFKVGMPADIMIYMTMTRNYDVIEHENDPWVIGDVHGCTWEYQQILEAITAKSSNPIIYQIGDLIDRGEGLIEVVELSKVFDVRHTIGNHELNFLQEYFGYKQCRSIARRENHDRLATYTKDDQDYVINHMLSMKNYITLDIEGGQLWELSHSPIKSSLSETQDCGNASNYCMINEPYENTPYNMMRYAHGHQHWNYTDIREQIDNPEQSWYNVDSGACYGHCLTALNLRTYEVIQIDSKRRTKE